ncbi:MAG: class C sortase [Clostridia bacterium]|nr:class C sortase [Clostridia bacterium]
MKKKNGQKSAFITTLLILIVAAGVVLMLYPTFSDLWNKRHSAKLITSYLSHVEEMSDTESEEEFARVHAYNDAILSKSNPFVLSETEEQTYNALLHMDADGMMGFLEIPSLEIRLPIYHGTEAVVLQDGVGHLDWTSLPAGGESTHCVLSSHRGLPSARLFTDLDKLKQGDLFTLTILNRTLVYEVDQIRTVDPTDVSELMIREGEDYCTLVTCTPYGINTHRLLVRGHRIEVNDEHEIRVISDAVLVDPMRVAPWIAGVLVLAVVVFWILRRPKKTENKSDFGEE